MAENVNISDLSFEGIRASLVDYLKTQETFKDYDFEGSAIKTIVDLLAYNTFYYGYYANMIANEMFLDTAKLENSMVSLTKPLGYLVPKYYSSRTQVKLNNLSSTQPKLSRFSVFRGVANSGRPYFFYNIKPVTVTNGTTDYFDVFEGRSVTNRELVSVNLTTQNFTLEGDRIDPRTIVIEVKQSDEDDEFIEWENSLINPNSIVELNTEIFFIERTKTGYAINFGKQTAGDISSSNTGKMIQSGNRVYVSYLTSSGENANAISTLQFVSDGSGLNIRTPTTSSQILYSTKNGVSTPNLDEIRFFAPKSFAKQNRLVTKGDYYAILNELGYGSGNETPDFDFKVFGGEEATPPVYGRVFVSLIDLNPLNDGAIDFSSVEQINQILSVLKNKSVVSILPEYIPPVEYPVSLNVISRLPNASQAQINFAKSAIKAKLLSVYGNKKYNQDMIKIEIEDECRKAVSGLVDVSATITVEFNLGPDLNQRKINLKNKLKNVSIPVSEDTNISSYKNDGKFIYAYNSTNQKLSNIAPIGEFYENEGIIIIYAGKLTGSISIKVEPDANEFYAKDEIVCYLNSNAINVTISQ